MKTSFTKLFTRITLAVALAGGMFASSASAQVVQFRIPGAIADLINGGHHGHHHQDHYHDDEDFGSDEYQYVQRPSRRPTFQPARPAQQSAMPQWLVGKWLLKDGRLGGSTSYEITADGQFTTISSMVTAQGVQETGRSTQTARFANNLLQVSGKQFQISSATPGELTFSGSGTTFKLQKVETNSRVNTPISNDPFSGGTNSGGQQPNVITIGGGGSRPVKVVTNNAPPAEMQGTWFEVSQNSKGQPLLNRYELNADATYEMFQYSISAEGDVDLQRPIAQLSKLTSAQERVALYLHGQLAIGVGKYAEGTYIAQLAKDANGQTVLSLNDAKESRTWTRTP